MATKHQKNLAKQRKRQQKQQLDNELKSLSISKNQIEEYDKRCILSYRHILIPLLEITKSNTLSKYYQELMIAYRNENYQFNCNNWWRYTFNPFALLFGLTYFAYQKLYFGLFTMLLVFSTLSPLLNNIPRLGILLIFHLFFAFTANFFIVHKAVHVLDKQIMNPKNNSEFDILSKVYQKHTSFRIFHALLGSCAIIAITGAWIKVQILLGMI